MSGEHHVSFGSTEYKSEVEFKIVNFKPEEIEEVLQQESAKFGNATAAQ